MKKPKRVTGKIAITAHRAVNQNLPAQIKKQLKKHYANKYHKYSSK